MKPQAPRPQRFPEGGPEALLDRRVREALAAVPAHFRTTTRIDGLNANGLFSLNSVMGNTIEIQVVETLNRLRHIWNPEGTIPSHKIVRSAQTFPDVRLMPPSGRALLGIELKRAGICSPRRESQASDTQWRRGPVRDRIYWSLFLGTLNMSLRDRLSSITLTWNKHVMLPNTATGGGPMSGKPRTRSRTERLFPPAKGCIPIRIRKPESLHDLSGMEETTSVELHALAH